MDRWVEPALPTPQPSYKEYPGLGLQPYGVLEGMAPLGVPPSGKLRKMVKDMEARRFRESSELGTPNGTPGPFGAAGDSAGDERSGENEEEEDGGEEMVVEGAEDSDVIADDHMDDIERAEREVEERERKRRELKRGREEEEDYVPGSKKKSVSQAAGRRQSSKRAAAMPKQSPILESVEPVPESGRSRRMASREVGSAKKVKKATATPQMTPTPRGASFVPVNATSPFKSTAQPQPTAHELALTDRAVQFAVEDAIHDRRWPTAYALRTLYNDTKINPRTPHLFMRIFREQASAAEIEEFQSLISWRKKEGRKDGTAKRYFEKFDNVYDGEGWRRVGWDKESSEGKKSKEMGGLLKATKSPSKNSGSSSGGAVAGGDSGGAWAESAGANLPTLTALTATAIPPHASATDPRKNARTLNNNPHLENNNRTTYTSPYGTRKSATPTKPSDKENSFYREERSAKEGKVTKSPRNAAQSVDARYHVTRHAANASIDGKQEDQDSDIEMAGGEVERSDAMASGSRARAVSVGSDSSLSSVDVSMFQSPEKKTRSVEAKDPTPPPPPAKKLTGAAAHKPKKATGGAAHKKFVEKKEVAGAKSGANATPSSSKNPTPAPMSKEQEAIEREREENIRSGKFDIYAPAHVVPKPKFRSAKKGANQMTDDMKGISWGADRHPRNLDFQEAKKKVRRAMDAEYKNAINPPSFERTPVVNPEPAPPPPRPLPKPAIRFKQFVPPNLAPAAAPGIGPSPKASPLRLQFRAENQLGDKASRATTPGDGEKGGRPKRDGKGKNGGARMKTSPQKKSAHSGLGFGPLGKTTMKGVNGFRSSPTVVGDHSQDDNDDFCASCHGGGELICCDGCTRSFHLKCLDPPMTQASLPDEWFCNVCVDEHRGPPPPSSAVETDSPADKGKLFGELFSLIGKKNPVSFHLPQDIRDYFEGVATGPTGEYQEVLPFGKKKNDLEGIDLLRLKDKDGSSVLCHACGRGTDRERHIITCAFCRLHWHLDCLDPPRAIPPVNSTQKPWRCPVHLDDLVDGIRGRKFRRIKGAKPIQPPKTRGFRNFGNIEVELEDDGVNVEGFVEEQEFGRIYTLPEEGIKLDFITRVHQHREEAAERRERQREREERARQSSILSSSTMQSYSMPPPGPGYYPPPPGLRPLPPPSALPIRVAPLPRHTLDEQQAALNLQFLAQAGRIDNDSMQGLVDQLLAQADPAAVALIARGDAKKAAGGSEKLEKSDVDALRIMKALIEERLGEAEKTADPATERVGEQNGDVTMGDDAEAPVNAASDGKKAEANANGSTEQKKRKRSDTSGTSDEQHEKKASKTGDATSSDAEMLI